MQFLQITSSSVCLCLCLCLSLSLSLSIQSIFLSALNIGPFPASLMTYFRLFKRVVILNLADDLIRTAVAWYRKRPLYQVHHNWLPIFLVCLSLCVNCSFFSVDLNVFFPFIYPYILTFFLWLTSLSLFLSISQSFAFECFLHLSSISLSTQFNSKIFIVLLSSSFNPPPTAKPSSFY